MKRFEPSTFKPGDIVESQASGSTYLVISMLGRHAYVLKLAHGFSAAGASLRTGDVTEVSAHWIEKVWP